MSQKLIMLNRPNCSLNQSQIDDITVTLFNGQNVCMQVWQKVKLWEKKKGVCSITKGPFAHIRSALLCCALLCIVHYCHQ